MSLSGLRTGEAGARSAITENANPGPGDGFLLNRAFDGRDRTPVRQGRILVPVSARWWRWTVGYVVVTVLAFLVLNWILALFVAILGLTMLVVGAVASDWENHSSFEERERARAGKRKEKWAQDAPQRAKDRALWERHHTQG